MTEQGLGAFWMIFAYDIAAITAYKWLGGIKLKTLSV